MASGWSHLHLIGKALSFDLLLESSSYFSSTISPTAGHTDIYTRFPLILLGENLVAIPLKFPNG
jgi:hypothetical protein